MTRKDNDFYPTPHSIVSALVDHLTWEGEVWEPCTGDGRFAQALREHGFKVICHDIVTGNNFFNFKTAAADTLITNPPFRDIRSFISHAFNIGVKRMALICPERLWACQKGKAQFIKHRPSKFINMDWREDYLQKGGKPDRSLAVSIWEEPCSPNTFYEIWSRKNGKLF
tara:strand:- start:4889 stop:5395 length:507 start_codon:yes stop_codon:yes gene_type:complete